MTSVVDTLRAKRAAQLGPKRLTLPVKGWDGMLFVRYRPMEWERLMEMLDGAAMLDAAEGLSSNLDALAEACEALLVKVEPDQYPGVRSDSHGRASLADVLRSQGEDVVGEIRFDEVASEVLDLGKVEDARGTVLAVFAGAVSPELAAAEHAARLGQWMRSTGEEVDDSLLGG